MRSQDRALHCSASRGKKYASMERIMAVFRYIHDKSQYSVPLAALQATGDITIKCITTISPAPAQRSTAREREGRGPRPFLSLAVDRCISTACTHYFVASFALSSRVAETGKLVAQMTTDRQTDGRRHHVITERRQRQQATAIGAPHGRLRLPFFAKYIRQ